MLTEIAELWSRVFQQTAEFAEPVIMANEFDAYRDALVVEHKTVWPAELAGRSDQEKARIEKALHASAAAAAELDYVRLHTGFCRTITVTQADIDRVAGK